MSATTHIPNLQGHAGFSLAADAFFKLFPRESRMDDSDPRMVVLFDLIDKAARAKTVADPQLALRDELFGIKTWLEYWLGTKRESRHSRDECGRIVNTWGVVPIPDWDVKQKLQAIAEVLAMEPPPEQPPSSEELGYADDDAVTRGSADTEPDEPVVQEKKCCGAKGTISAGDYDDVALPCDDCPEADAQEVNRG